MTAAPLVTMSSVSKSFGGIAAISNVSFELVAGTVHALMGENGAGKSTLMKVLAGVVRPDHGTIQKNGKAVSFSSPREALDGGVSTVFQELSLLPNLTVAENMFLGRELLTRFGRVDTKAIETTTRRTLDQLGLSISPRSLVSRLSIAERQFVEIARGITADADVIILDEPTAALNAADVETLNKQIRTLKAQGKGVIYISHRIEEIFRICDSVSVLKDGRNVATVPVKSVTTKELVGMMVGRDIADFFPARSSVVRDEVVLALTNIRLTAMSKPISLKLHSGEIVGLAGLEGQGQHELLRALVGDFHPYKGEVTIKGVKLSLPLSLNIGVRLMQSLGLGFVPEDRKEEGLFLDLSIAHNIVIGLHSRRNAGGYAKAYRTLTANTIRSMAIKVATPSTPVGRLSGGNQQKALLGRYLAMGSQIMLIEEPTRGVDVGAKAAIYDLLRAFTEEGGAIIVLSRETLELIGLCDRLYVVHEKSLVAEMSAEAATEHSILEAALHRERSE